MSGQIFISYRREDSSAWAGRLSDRLSTHFPSNQIFMDVDTIEPGIDFVEAIEESVGSCDVLIAVIGTRWLNSSNPAGNRRLEIPEDSVRVEVSTALKRGIRVIPVLVEGATMPEAADLPDELKALVRRNALKLSHDRFRTESELLASTVGQVLEKAEAKRREREETERLETKRRETEEKERREAERRQKEEEEQAEADQRHREETERVAQRREREQRAREKAEVRERQEEDARRDENEEQERLASKSRQRKSEGRGREQREEKAAPPLLKPSLSRDDAVPPPAEGPTIAPSWRLAKTKWLLAIALALIAGIGGIWFAANKERTTLPEPIMKPTLPPTDKAGADDHYRRGVTFDDDGKSADAVTEFTEAIRLDPNSPVAYYRRSSVYRKLGQTDKADADLATARQLNHVETPTQNKADADGH